MPKPCEKVREKRDDMVQDILLFGCYNVVLPWQITRYARDFFYVNIKRSRVSTILIKQEKTFTQSNMLPRDLS